MTEVVVTGIGIVSPLGGDTETTWTGYLTGQACFQPIPERWLQYSEYQSRVWSPLPMLDFRRWGLSRLDHMKMDPVSMLAIASAHQAIQQADLEIEPVDNRNQQFTLPDLNPERCGVFMGTGIGGIHTTLETHLFHTLNKPKVELTESLTGHADEDRMQHVLDKLSIGRRFNPLAVTMLMSNAVAAAPGIRYGMSGPCKTYTSACASGTVAIGEGYRAIQSGRVDLALCGGSEYLDDDFGSIFKSYDITGALTKGGASGQPLHGPFDSHRSGFLFSQGGSAVMVLESAQLAQQRKARPLARIRAYADSFDAHNMIAMKQDAASIKSMLGALLNEADLGTTDIDYISAHGTGTELNDKIEADLLGNIFPHLPPVNSGKGIIGHTIGASGAIEAAINVLSIQDQTVHPNANLSTPGTRLNLPTTASRADIRHTLSESFAFGGHNASLIISEV